MTWLSSRRNQMLVGGCLGALAGGAIAHFLGLEQELVPVFAGFALGQVVAVVAGALLQRRRSLEP